VTLKTSKMINNLFKGELYFDGEITVKYLIKCYLNRNIQKFINNHSLVIGIFSKRKLHREDGIEHELKIYKYSASPFTIINHYTDTTTSLY